MKVIELRLIRVKRGEWELRRVSDGRRECLPFRTFGDATKWAKETILNGTVYRIGKA